MQIPSIVLAIAAIGLAALVQIFLFVPQVARLAMLGHYSRWIFPRLAVYGLLAAGLYITGGKLL